MKGGQYAQETDPQETRTEGPEESDQETGEEEMNETINQILNELLKAVIVLGVPVVIGFLGAGWSWLKVWIDAHVTNQILLRIAHEAEVVVGSVGQTMADQMKEAAKDGKLTPEEMQRCKTAAMDALKARLVGLPAQFVTTERLGQSIEAAVAAQASPPQAPGSK